MVLDPSLCIRTLPVAKVFVEVVEELPSTSGLHDREDAGTHFSAGDNHSRS